MEIERICNFCNEKFKTNSRNYGIRYKDNKIYVCKKCMYVTKKCSFCGKDVKIIFSKIDKKIFCNRSCMNKNNAKYKIGLYSPENVKKSQETMKIKCIGIYDSKVKQKTHETMHVNNVGLYNSNVRAKGQKASHTPKVEKQRTETNKKNKNGFFDKKVQEKINISNKLNKKAIYDPEIRAAANKTIRENKTGVYDPKVRAKGQKASEKSQKENKTGLYDPEIRKNNNKIMKENKIGFYNLGIQKHIHDTQKLNGTGIYNKEQQKRIHEMQKINKTGIYNPKIKEALIEKFKVFIISNISINLSVVNSFNEIIPATYSSFDIYNKIPGIWAIWGEDSDDIKLCLDVCQTKDIGNEMRKGLRKLITQKNKKYKKFINYKNIIFILIKSNILDFKERELLEAIYAVKNNSIYWSPSPTQLKLLRLTEEQFRKYALSIKNKNLLKKEVLR